MAEEKKGLLRRTPETPDAGERAVPPVQSGLRPAGIQPASKPIAAPGAPKKGVVTIRSLRIRKGHGTTFAVVGGLVEGNEVTIYETWTDGKDTWVRIGEDQWCGMIHDGNTYIKYVE